MCGIAGVWGQVDPERLGVMTETLRHRGPDDEGYWEAPGGAFMLGHRRLSIIDLEGGRQPITSEDGRIVTVLNGAIYNYRELREDLIARGHRFETQSDTEVIVHLYEERGADFVSALRGMFAVAVWDDVEHQLVLARDRVGKKPLYYSELPDEFLFASEIRAVVAGLRAPPVLDEQALADFLFWTVVPAPATIYRQVRAIRPGELVVVRDRRVTRMAQFWRQQMLPKVHGSPARTVEQMDQLLHEAVRLRLRSDVPVGCFLSGGIDSGVITAIAAQHHPERLTTLTVGFEADAMDERPLAREVARRYGTDHHEMVVRPDVNTDLPRIIANYSQPYGDSSAIPSYYVAQAARQHVKVVLNGDGGDELLAGYRRYVAAWLSGLFAWTDVPGCQGVWAFLARLLPVPRRFRSGYAFLHRLVRGLGMTPDARYLAWAVDGVDPAALRTMSRPNAGAPWSGWLDRLEPGARLLGPVLDRMRPCGSVDRMLAADFGLILPHDHLVKMDIATMTHGLEARSPLLDQEFVDAVSRYPESLKLRGFRTKPLLRDLSRRYLPAAIRTAPKRGFEVPLVEWLQGELHGLTEDVILSRNGLLADLFDRSALERLVRGRAGLDPARWSRRVWLLLVLGLWDRLVFRLPRCAPWP
jgi:asparagine synthase (glutamine-hydrolysing)